jgi:hypothetical protein
MSAVELFFASRQWMRVSSKSNIIVFFFVGGGKDFTGGFAGFYIAEFWT